MKIIIIRHGKVDYPPLTRMSAIEFADWAKAYNSNALDLSVQPPCATQTLAAQSTVVVCSTLRRSIESANSLGKDVITVSDTVFNEADLPIAHWTFPKLSVRLWAILFRLAWLCGYNNGSESVSETKMRAQGAAMRLIAIAQQHETVLFVGHGIINRLIAKVLRQQGWQGPKKPSSRYWGASVYTHQPV